MASLEGDASGVKNAEEKGPYWHLRVAEVIEETEDSRSIVFEIPPEQVERFAYTAGQFLTFRIEVDGHRLVRCYSLASAPGIDPAPKVTIKRVVEGRVSNWMNENVAKGDVLEVMPPNGEFCLREIATPIVFFGGGSGITPIISIVKVALETTDRPLKLVYANRNDASIIFKDELAGLVARHSGRLEIVHRLDDVDGFVDAELVVHEVGDRSDADFYICGPGPFMDVVEQGLARLAISEAQIFIERFEAAEPSPVSVPLDSTSGTTVTIKLDGVETEVSVGDGETILAAARRAGLEPPFACEEAYCGCCMAKVVEGTVDMLMNDGGIDQRQVDQGWVLTCQGIVKDRARVEYPD
jgi:3-ketosteroid 9alpha-monooxygenase subunit B